MLGRSEGRLLAALLRHPLVCHDERMGWRSERLREFAVAANDGIIGTAGVLQGFAGAGASSSQLLVASVSALVAGSVASFGSKYAEIAAERDAQRAIISQEERELTDAPADEIAVIAAHFVSRGLDPAQALDVATTLHAHDPLTAQLENEHGIDEVFGRWAPVRGALAAALAFITGSALPLVMLLVYPRLIESWAVFGVVIVSLVVTAILIGVATGTSIRRTLFRTLTIGVATMMLSFLAGTIVF